jgi:hypothetical protein
VRAYVEYDAPVSALVDTETGQVERVMVWCEFLKQREGDEAVLTVDHEKPVTGPSRKEIQEIVDSMLWPAWDFE